MTLTEAQKTAVRMCLTWSSGGNYMPYAYQARSFDACVRKGAMVYHSVDDGYRTNGYAVTEAGKAAL